jgi:CBS domain containing-hemolysin-like protein
MSDAVFYGGAAALLLAPVTLLLSTLSALLERSGPIRLRPWAEEAGGRLLTTYEDPQRFEVYRFLLSVAARLALLALAAVVGFVAALVASPGRAATSAFLAAALVVVIAELLNRMLVARAAESSLRVLTLGYRVLAVAILPFAATLSRLPPFRVPLRTPDLQDEASEEEIEAFIDVGTREGILEPAQADLVRGVVDFGETVVRSVMTPRIDIFGAPVDATPGEAAALFVESKHTRLPVYVDTADQIVGIVHVLDVVAAPRDGDRRTVAALAKPPLVVPETKPLKELLREFQSTGHQMAIVVNEHGTTAGLVTIEDLLEEIVGEIGDEYEPASADTSQQALPGGGWRLDGSTHVETLGELFEVELENPPFETVGGLVMSVLGTAPKAGDRVEAHGLRFTVESVDGRRVEQVLVEPASGGA